MTKIEWTHRPGTTGETWNPVTGCSKVSAGCQNCYAERMAKRLAGRFGYPADDPFRVKLQTSRINHPVSWRKPRTVFVCSMSDLFHDEISADYIYEILQRVYEGHQHVFLILTKRADRMREIMSRGRYLVNGTKPMKNLWLGVTAENQTTADERIPLLLQTPAAMRFVSVEPMLGPVDFTIGLPCAGCGGSGYIPDGRGSAEYCGCGAYTGVDWLIIGCESGPNRRPCKLEWVRDLVQQAQSANVPVFVKQLDINGQVSKDPSEWPEDLRVREWPQSTTNAVSVATD